MNGQIYQNNELRKKVQNYSYKLQDIIGRGHNSIVYRGINQKNLQIVAIKTINIKNLHGKTQRKLLQGQIDVLKKLNHANIIKCYDVFTTVNNCYIITQFCNQGDLQTLLRKRNCLPEQQAIPIIRNILQAFKCITQTQIIHRNLKPSNLLMKDKITKISGFSFAKKINSHYKQQPVNDAIFYKSPQSLDYHRFSQKSQIWSIGIIIYQMLHGKIPWISENEQKLKTQIKKTNITLISNLSQDLKDLIRKCLIVQQQRRINFKQFMSHPFVLRICQKGISDLLIGDKRLIQQKSQKNIFRNIQNNDAQKYKSNNTNKNIIYPIQNTQKQLQCQINWMRFLYKLNQLFPKANQSGKSTLNLRFIICKQLLSQLQNLKKSFIDQNIFGIYQWKNFIKKQSSIKYLKVLEQYTKKYQKNKKDFQDWIQIVKKDKRMDKIADNNLTRSQNLYIQAIYASLQQCKGMWKKLKQKLPTFKDQQLPSPWKQQLLRLDFVITYYQLNCIMIDNFQNAQNFTKNSKLQNIVQYKPIHLGMKQTDFTINYEMNII